MISKRDIAFLVLGFSILGCAGGGLTYTYYNMDLPDGCYEKGRLRAQLPKDDRSLSECQPDPDPTPGASPVPKPNKMKCAVFKEAEKTRLFTDLGKCIDALKACEQGPQ